MENDDYDIMHSWSNELDQSVVQLIDIPAQKIPDDTEPAQCDNNRTDNIECLYIEDIIEKNPADMTSSEILRCECSVAYFVQILIEEIINGATVSVTEEKNTDILSYLQWISDMSGILSKRIGQKPIDNCPGSITRSSYNFCPKYVQCRNFYNIDESPTCSNHHYVHSILKNDVDSIINSLKIHKQNLYTNKDYIIELSISINTICFVTRHMANELNYIDNITKNSSEKFHRNNISLQRCTKKPKSVNETNISSNNLGSIDKKYATSRYMRAKLNTYSNENPKNKKNGTRNKHVTLNNDTDRSFNLFDVLDNE